MSLDLEAIYTPDWKQRIADYFSQGSQFSGASGYWAFQFERQWIKHRAAVPKETRLVEALGHWMPPVGQRVLVMGSWLGAEAIAFARCGSEVTAIDLDGEAVRLSAELADRWGVALKTDVMDASATTFTDEQFDLVSCSQVLEHLPPQRQDVLLAEMWRLCRPGGIIWLDTPNQFSPRDQHDTGLYFVHWLPRPLKTRLARWLGRDVPTNEPGFGFKQVGLHWYISYLRLMRILRTLGPHEVLSRYRGYADVNHYAAQRRREGRGNGNLFFLKLAAMRTLMPIWNFNWLNDIRLVIRKGQPISRTDAG